jgi:hypothetical protein
VNRIPLMGVVLMTCLWSLPARSANWVTLPMSSMEGSDYALDVDSAERSGPIVRVWERLVFKRFQEDSAFGAFHAVMFHMAYNCRRRSAAILETRFYRDIDLKQLTANRIRAKPRYLYVAPDSPSEMKLEEACKIR